MVTTRRQAKQNCIQTCSKTKKNQPAKTTQKTKKPKDRNRRLIGNGCYHPIDIVDQTCYQFDERSETACKVCWMLPMYCSPEVLQNMMVAACPTFTLKLLNKLNLHIDDKTLVQIVCWSIDAFMEDILPLVGWQERSFDNLCNRLGNTVDLLLLTHV